MLTSSRVLTTLLGVLVVAGVIATIVAVFQSPMLVAATTGVGALLVVGLLVAHLRGWRWSPQATVILVTLVLIASVPADQTRHEVYLFEALIPAILAMVLLPWFWVAGAFIACFVGIFAQVSIVGTTLRAEFLIVLLVMAAGCVLASLVNRSEQHRAEQHARRAEEARVQAEQQSMVLAEQTQELQEQNVEQRRLLELVSVLEVPTVTLAEGVLLAPIVGSLDSHRATTLTNRLLHSVNDNRARLLILDIAGVATVDTMVARALLNTIKAVRLLGCDVTISGISAAVATTMTHLGIQLDGVVTARSPQEALSLWSSQPARGAAPSNGARAYGNN